MKSTQYTIRNVPLPVDRVLRTRARKQGKSFNQTVVEALRQATGATNNPTDFNDLDWFIGNKSIDKKAFDQAQSWLDKLPSDLS